MMNTQSFPPGTTILINSLNRPFQDNKKSVCLPGAVRHPFLQTPSWTFALNKIKYQPEKSNEDEKISENSNTTLIANPLPNLTLQIHLPAYYSVATVLRCGHMSQLVGKWLCNPMEQLKKQSKLAYLPSSSQLNISTPSIMPTTNASSYQNQENDDAYFDKTNSQNSLVRYKKNDSGLTSLSLCLEDHKRNLQALELVFINTLPLETSTVISISYKCGSFSISIQSVSSLELISSTAYPVPVLVNCQFNQTASITLAAVTQFGDSPVSSFIPYQMTSPIHSIEDITDEPSSISEVTTAKITAYSPNIIEKELSYDTLQPEVVEFSNTYFQVWNPEDFDMKFNQLIDFEQEELLEYLDDSSEEYDDSEDSEVDDSAHIALLSLVQDTLEYIKSNRGAYSDELNALKDKLQNYYISCFE